MVELFSSRRRAEEFARLLAGEQETADARLQRLLDTASRLAAVPVVEPRGEFRDVLRDRLLEAAAVELPAQAAARAEEADHADRPAGATGGAVVADDEAARRRRRRLVAVATGMVLVGGGAGVAAASEQALPGEMLYPVKRTLESAEVSLAQDAGGEGRALLERASTRLEEAESLSSRVSTGETELAGVQEALADFTADADAGGHRLLDAYAADGDPADLRALRDFTGDAHAALADLAETLPPEVQPAVAEADETVVSLDGLAKRACPDCTTPPPMLNLPTEPVSLPDLPDEATPDVPGREPLTVRDPQQQRAGGQRAGSDDRRQQRRQGSSAPRAPAEAGDGDAPSLPDLELDGPAAPQPQDQDAAPDERGGDDARPGVDLGEVLDQRPAPSQRPRTTDGPDLGDVGEVTEPLREPLEPLLDGTRRSLEEPLKPLRDGTRKPLEDTTGTLDGLF